MNHINANMINDRDEEREESTVTTSEAMPRPDVSC